MDNQWKILEDECIKCQKCALHNTRKNVVIERGNRQAKILFIGEGPGATEDEQGKAFVGQAGKLLDLALGSMGIYEKDIYVCNIIKCRPPNNSNPTDEQAKACMPYLKRQINLVNPAVIVLLGSVALKRMINKDLTITRSRGNWMDYEGIKVMPTFHPAALLRDEKKKMVFWKDINKAWKSLTD